MALIRLLRRRAPREGWLLFLLPLAALLMLPLAAEDAGWVPRLGWLLAIVVVLGYSTGFGLARWAGRRQSVLAADGIDRWDLGLALLSALLGLLVVSLLVGWGEAAQVPETVRWYLVLPVRIGLALLEVFQRLALWIVGVSAGGATQDDLVFRWLVGLVAWGAACWAGWWLFRHRKPLVALAPLGLLLAINAYFYWNGRVWLPLFLGLLVLVGVALQRYDQEERWRATGMDFSEDVKLEVALTAIALGVVVVIISAAMPRVVFRPTADWFARALGEPISGVEEAGQALFPGLRRSPRSLLATGGAPGSLPRSFLLGSGPELGQELVMKVATDELSGLAYGEGPDRALSHYWRAVTYDQFDGRGWRNSASVEERFDAGEPWIDLSTSQRRAVRQVMALERGGDRAIYAAGEPLAPNRPYDVRIRTGSQDPGDDLVALLAEGRQYNVLSLVPAADEVTLRSTGADYPAGLERYLVLPPLTGRVAELAQELAAEASTPYDQALTIQDYLRGYRYDLQVEPAPPGQDVVDYFLFDAQAGYCDYYASAMIVLARSVGIPSRLAVGYATGDFDANSQSFWVYEDDAHSWPELYFPGVGWVPFEPTAARPVFERLSPAGLGGEALAQGGDIAADLQVFREDEIVRRRLRWLMALLAIVLIGTVALIIRWRRPEPGLVALYGYLGRWGARLGRQQGTGDTPAEYGRALSQELQRTEDAQARHTAGGVQDFVRYFELAQYGRDRAGPEAEARRVWSWLEPALRRVWLLRFFRS